MDPKILVLSQGPHHIAVFKPHNMAVIGGQGVVRPTLLDCMRKMFGAHISAVHRLDRATAGITVFARSLFAKHALENAFKKRLVKKTYFAICEGTPGFKKQSVNQPLKKIDLDHKKGPAAKTCVDPQGEASVTNFKLLRQLSPEYCLIEAQPVSGRMHQIRAHLAYLGLPIVGDVLYGAKKTCAPHTIALCAVGLSLPLPRGGRVEIDARAYFKPENYVKITNN
jgi:23S rRNA-/tRNA-specific pseudouridylate synthase